MKIIQLQTSFIKILEDISPFCGATDTRFGPLVTTALCFKARVDSLTGLLHHLCAMHSSDSPLVRHLLTSWRPTWRLSRFDPRIYLQIYRNRIAHVDLNLLMIRFAEEAVARSSDEPRRRVLHRGSAQPISDGEDVGRAVVLVVRYSREL